MKKLISILTAVFLLSTLIGGATISVSASNSNDGGYDVVLFEDGFETATQLATDSDEDGLYDGNITTLYNQVTETWTLSMIADNKEKALHTYASADAQRGSKGLALYDESGATGKTGVLSPTTMTDGLRHFKVEFELNVPDNARRYFRYHKKASPFLDVRTGSGHNYVKLFSGITKVDYTPGTWVKIGFIINVDAQEMQLYVGGELKETCTLTDLTNIPNYFSYETASKTSTEEPSLIDNVKISVPSILTVASTLPADKAENITPDTTYKITGSRNLNEYDLAGMSVKDSKGADVDYTYAISGKEVTLTFDSLLKLEETYTVSFNGENYTFKTEGDVPESIYYPNGMTWDTMQYHVDGAAFANSSAWALNKITGDNISIVNEANGNKYAQVTGSSENSYYYLDYNIGVEYKDGSGNANENKYLYYTMQIAGWESGYNLGNLTIAPVYANSSVSKAPSAPIYLNNTGMLAGTYGSKVANINPIQESSALGDKFYRIDIIFDMQEGIYYIYVDGQKFREGTQTDSSSFKRADYTGIKAFRIYPEGAGRRIKLDNVGYKVYSSDVEMSDIMEEVFPIDRITSLSAYSLDSNNAEGRRYRVVVRGSADEGAGSYIVAAYDKDGKIIDVRNLNGRRNENEQTTMGAFTRNGSFVTDIVHGKGLESLSEVKTIKAFLLDMSSLKPVTECATLDSSRFNNYQ